MVRVVWIVGWTDVLHLVDTATFVASFVRAITRDLIELVRFHHLTRERLQIGRVRIVTYHTPTNEVRVCGHTSATTL